MVCRERGFVLPSAFELLFRGQRQVFRRWNVLTLSVLASDFALCHSSFSKSLGWLYA